MELNELDQLLEKYDQAKTTLTEEEQLRAYFETAEVPAHLEPYKALFQYLNHSRQERFAKALPLQKQRRSWYWWGAAAAVAAILMTAYFQQGKMEQKISLDTLSQEQLIAYNQTLEVFNLVSSKLNRGANSLKAIGLVSSKLNEGAENLEHLRVFAETTNKVIKNE